MIAIILWIVIGGIAGWIASKIMGTDASMGIIANIIVGILGAVIGGWLLGIFMDIDMGSGNWFVTLITAVVGACLLLWIVGLFTKRGSRV
ncbi:GlsB/YeaQ/YmgE family stress response membrane protein [Corynebacterium ulceribovis]|uniref:GlsB/YeaQ/YmgE family stress response membrane protein n=1 Tax=Corynebacterium ulceribovis TaxID=487732 RepID=UPI00036A3640|nr:GlsB/YeaQ/YmgE family stress response membrane protein [Corynebacterium ulceribovis]